MKRNEREQRGKDKKVYPELADLTLETARAMVGRDFIRPNESGPDVTLRPATPADRDFLLRVYAESRAEELAAARWTDEERHAFCRAQFEAQDAHYRRHYPGCEYLVIERKGAPIGRLYRDRRPDEIRVVDIALLSAERGKGIGGHLIVNRTNSVVLY